MFWDGGRPWGAPTGGRPIGRCDCGCACAAPQDKAKTDRATTNLQSWLVLPHAIFIPGDQFIQIGHDVIILWIDFRHYIWVICSRPVRGWMMRSDSHTDHDDDNSRRRGKSPPTKPAAHPIKTSRLLANAPHYVPGKERRQRGLGNATEYIPQFLVIFTIHSLQSIELSAEMEVALEWWLKIHIHRPGASRKPSSCRIRVGCRILRKAFASIWRMRSRVTWNCRPTSSKVRLYPSTSPNRCSSTCRSLSVSVSSTSLIFSFSKTMAVISLGFSAPLSSIKSPKFVSSLSPTGDWSEIGCCAIFRTARTRSTGRSTSSATSSGDGSRLYSCTSCFCTRMSLLIVSIMWTGIRIVRAWSAMERVMAWRIHHVA